VFKNIKNILNLIFEFGQLKRVKRSGWWAAGIKDPESVADHTARACFIGYILSKLENVDSEKVILMILSHDMPESRINDQNKVEARYINRITGEKKAFEDQVKNLPKNIRDELLALHREFEEDLTKEALIAKDADYLECAIQAKEYLEVGYKKTEDWINNVGKVLKTKSAKEIFVLIKNSDSLDWWKDLKKIPKR
jgi:putative hydrolase of HD superfamily